MLFNYHSNERHTYRKAYQQPSDTNMPLHHWCFCSFQKCMGCYVHWLPNCMQNHKTHESLLQSFSHSDILSDEASIHLLCHCDLWRNCLKMDHLSEVMFSDSQIVSSTTLLPRRPYPPKPKLNARFSESIAIWNDKCRLGRTHKMSKHSKKIRSSFTLPYDFCRMQNRWFLHSERVLDGLVYPFQWTIPHVLVNTVCQIQVCFCHWNVVHRLYDLNQKETHRWKKSITYRRKSKENSKVHTKLAEFWMTKCVQIAVNVQ